MKHCIICKEPFEPEYKSQRICKKEHYASCPVCGRKLIWNSTQRVTGCSIQCSNQLRKHTLMSRYDVTNARALRTGGTSHYDNFKYIQAIDRKYTEMWASYGIDVWQCNVSSNKHRIVDSTQFAIYFLHRASSDEFMKDNGVSWRPSNPRGMSIGLVKDNIIWQALRMERSPIKHYNYAITDMGRSVMMIREGYSKLLNYVVNLYEFDSIIMDMPYYPELEDDARDLGMTYIMDRPGQVWWVPKVVPYRKTDDIQTKLYLNQVPHVNNYRKVYTRVIHS